MSYYHVESNTETCVKIDDFFFRRNKILKAIDEHVKSLGAKQSLKSNYYVAGGMVGVRFLDKENWSAYDEIEYSAPKGWRWDKQNEFWRPRLSTKEGKELKKGMRGLPSMTVSDLGEAVGVERDTLHGVHSLQKVKEGFGYVVLVSDLVETTLHNDCVKIKQSEYLILLGK